MKRKKYTERDLIRDNKVLVTKKIKYTDKIDIKRNVIASKFLRDNSTFKLGAVYRYLGETVGGQLQPNRKIKYKMFLTKNQTVSWLGDRPMIILGGYWLDSRSRELLKWGFLTVWGVGNPATLELDTNQGPFPEGR